MRKKLWKVIAILAIVAGLFALATPTAAQSGTVTEYGQLPPKGQLIVPAGKGFVAPDAWNGLNVTVWYGTADDTENTMANLGNGIGTDRAAKYGGAAADYPTVLWGGPSVHVGGQCRGQFYSDATILTAGVVYGDECPLLIEYNAEGHFIAPPATQAPAPTAVAPLATPQPTAAPTKAAPTVQPTASPTPTTEAPPTDGGGFVWNWGWCVWPLAIAGLLIGAIWLLRRRPAAPRPPAPPAPVVAPAPVKDAPVLLTPPAPMPKAPAPPAPVVAPAPVKDAPVLLTPPAPMRDHRPAAPQLAAGRAQSRQGKPRSQTGKRRGGRRK